MARIAVEISVANVTEEGVTFNVADMSYRVLGENLTIEQIIAREDWRSYMTVHPIKVAEVDVKNARAVLSTLKALIKELDAYRDERSMAYGDRYQALTAPGGLIDQVEGKISLYKLAAYVVTRAVLGMSATDMRNMGLC